ncbi:hypothetical protein EVAR_83329_1 [Eumeta japonica]|uniref:Uncharacterized protein n=1 Tax=Eumeta variegata TaxID=151549 RepID=A0A4C1VVK8_EUMVA|nr:hypothetical protein EVAR_83329_1 [Eumeta japonica]
MSERDSPIKRDSRLERHAGPAVSAINRPVRFSVSMSRFICTYHIPLRRRHGRAALRFCELHLTNAQLRRLTDFLRNPFFSGSSSTTAGPPASKRPGLRSKCGKLESLLSAGISEPKTVNGVHYLMRSSAGYRRRRLMAAAPARGRCVLTLHCQF